ncbi:MAG: DeoR/GlpR family DNA-binding transcription regulator [Chloroflexota bacterium]
MSRRKDIFREERLQLIVERLLEAKKIYVTDLAREFNLSSSSIRMDLAELEVRGLLQRTYGGAILTEKMGGNLVMNKLILHAREETLREEKDAIGQAAAALIEDGDTLMIDGGSTLWHVAHHLQGRRNLTIVTNATNLLPVLLEIPDSEIYVSGGLLRRHDEILVGDIALDILGRFNTAKCLLGMDGVSLEFGLTATDFPIAAAKRKMIASCKQILVICDHTKLGHVCLLPVAPLEKMDYLITDSGAAPAFLAEIRRRGPQVITG